MDSRERLTLEERVWLIEQAISMTQRDGNYHGLCMNHQMHAYDANPPREHPHWDQAAVNMAKHHTAKYSPEKIKVYVVHEHPDMTYYGDGVVHGVFLDPEKAATALGELSDLERPRTGIEEWELQ